MSPLHEKLAAAIHAMALKGSDEAKDELRRAAKQYLVQGWTAAQIAKAGAVGAVTGLPGGPLGLALEGLDIAYLLGAAGRGCYGVGHIKGRDVDYESDLSIILAIWCGAAEACGAIAAGKVGIRSRARPPSASGRTWPAHWPASWRPSRR